MTAEVRSIDGKDVSPMAVQARVVGRIEEWLALAKAGQITQIAAAWTDEVGQSWQSWEAHLNSTSMAGAIAKMQHNYLVEET